MSELVLASRDGAVAILTINNPPVNALSPGVPEGIAQGLRNAAADPAVSAVVILGGGRTFIAGADIREFGKVTSGEKKPGSLHPLLAQIEDCPKPVIMAIHGTAFGGGLEVAMAGHYRVATPEAQVGQPEVKLGIIPGAGGTQRLPRLAGVAKAVEMCAFGEPVAAREAARCGIVDRIIEGDLLAGALEFAREVASRTPPKTRERADRLGDSGASAAAIEGTRKNAAKRMRGQTAPLAAIQAVEAATRLSFEDGLRREADLFRQCLYSEQSSALIHVFFGERTVARIPDVPNDTPVLPIRKAAVIGAGTMGGGIAMNYANAGIPVLLKEISQDALDRGLATIRRNYEGTVRKGRLTQDEMDRRLALIRPTLDYSQFHDADIIIEAVFEDMELKKATFAEIDRVAREGAILASNTSTLDIDQIASATRRPHMVIGHHFFSPASVMRLVEIVRGRETAKTVIATSMDLARRLRKVGVLAGNCRGFIGNRMFDPYTREAIFMVEEGTPPERVDAALYEFGWAMGPLAVLDLAGLDVGWRIRREFRHLEQAGVRYAELGDRLCEAGRFGQKTRAGFYRYDENRNSSPDPEAARIIRETAEAFGVPQRPAGPEEIVERTVYALVNEGARLLEEGIALRPVDIDIVYINGYGFPAWRGGPMKYADQVGLARVLERVSGFHGRFGDSWRPAPLLERLVREGKTFGGFDREKT